MSRRGGLGSLLSWPLFACGFVAASSVAGDLSQSVWWMLGCGLGLCLVLPVGLTLWLRGLAGDGGGAPRVSTLVALVNLVVLAVLVGLAGQRTGQALAARGAWWVRAVAQAVGAGADAPLVRAAERGARLVASGLRDSGGLADEGRRGALARTDGPAAGERRETRERGGAVSADEAVLGQVELPSEPELPSESESLAGNEGLPQGQGQDVDRSGEVRVAFERRGSGIVVPVTLVGPEARVPVKMLLDTGATLSTINARTLGQLGLYVTSADPTVVMNTANGRVQRTLTVLEGAAVGSGEVTDGLTVALCEVCASGEVVGLLGLNFTRHFLLTVDQSGGELSLLPNRPGPGHLFDIRPFVRITDVEGVRMSKGADQGQDALFKVALKLHNRSPRALTAVRVVAVVKGPSTERVSTVVDSVPPRQVVAVRFSGKVRGRITGFRVELESARW